MGRLSPEQIAELVERSVADQGLAVKITDPTVVRSVSVLLGVPLGAGRAHARSASTDRADGRSVQPDGPDPVRVDRSRSVDSGQDHHVVDDGLDDRGLPVQRERRPRGA